MTTIDYKAYFDQAISYNKYKTAFEAEMEDGSSPYAQYLPQNWSRQSRLDRKFKLSEELKSLLGSTQNKKNWLVITEHWCGDASQILPVINRIAEESDGKIDLRFVYRDENEELINAHLTDGISKSIPIIIELDEAYQVVKTYGPRPEKAQELVKKLLAKKEPYNIPLHTWYAKNKQQDLISDLKVFLK
jgi:thiol-disulfide isomerase/thioredoxin